MPTLEEMWGESFWENPEFEESLEFGSDYDTASYAEYIGMDYDPEDPGAFWSQVGGEQWGGINPETGEPYGPEQGDVPDFWYYEDVEDSAYTDLEDILYDISGGALGYGDIASDEGMGAIGTGETESYWDLYMDEFFEFDEETGEYVTRYDPQEFEKSERRQLDIGRRGVTSGLESSLGKYRQSQGRSLSGQPLDIGDIATMAEGEMDPIQEKYRTGVEASTQSWTDDVYASISEMAGELEWEDYI